MTFVFGMGNSECHEKLTGTCSLEKPAQNRTEDAGGESGYDYCPKLLKSLTSGEPRGRRLPVDIIQCKCGHWEFNDGQHRICIAKRKELSIEAEVSTLSNQLCEVCAGRATEKMEIR